jgi:hypothetical protein
MPHTTETRTFIGQEPGSSTESFAGFRVGQAYDLRYTVLQDGRIAIEPDHVLLATLPFAFEAVEFKKWFKKV